MDVANCVSSHWAHLLSSWPAVAVATAAAAAAAAAATAAAAAVKNAAAAAAGLSFSFGVKLARVDESWGQGDDQEEEEMAEPHLLHPHHVRHAR